jgi:hypothetical protein
MPAPESQAACGLKRGEPPPRLRRRRRPGWGRRRWWENHRSRRSWRRRGQATLRVWDPESESLGPELNNDLARVQGDYGREGLGSVQRHDVSVRCERQFVVSQTAMARRAVWSPDVAPCDQRPPTSAVPTSRGVGRVGEPRTVSSRPQRSERVGVRETIPATLGARATESKRAAAADYVGIGGLGDSPATVLLTAKLGACRVRPDLDPRVLSAPG